MNSNILNHKIFGTGAPVIILHGLFGMLDNWLQIAKKMQATHQVILVDLRNHGRSMWSQHFSYQEMASDIVHLMRHLEMKTSAIVGHSMGGKVAMELAKNNPHLISRLVVVDITPRAYPRGHDAILTAINELPLEMISNRKQAETMLLPLVKDIGVTLFLLKNLSRKPGGNFEWKANFRVLERDYAKIIDAIELDQPIAIPSLFVRGTRSDYITDRDIDQLQEVFTHLEITNIDAGHWIHAEAPDPFLQTLERFLI